MSEPQEPFRPSEERGDWSGWLPDHDSTTQPGEQQGWNTGGDQDWSTQDWSTQDWSTQDWSTQDFGTPDTAATGNGDRGTGTAKQEAGKQEPGDRETVGQATEGQETGDQGTEPKDTQTEGGGPRSKWKTIGFGVVAALLLFALVRAMLGGADQGALDTTGGQPGAKNPLPAPPQEVKPPTALVEGARIPVNGPVITLNPGLVRQGARVGVSGVGFDTRAFVDVEFSVNGGPQAQPVGGGPVGRNGQFNAEFTVPAMPGAERAVITARQRGSGKVARADAVVPGGVGFVQLSKETGRPGDQLNVSGSGFQPNEKVNVHWGRIDGPPSQQLQADKNGGLSNTSLRVGVTPVGNGTLLLIGDRSKTTATTPFIMQGLYPTVNVQPYALKAAQRLDVSAQGFAPREPVLLYINSSSGEPALKLPAGEDGSVNSGFVIPFELNGGQTLTMVGEQSRASSTSGFEVMPYSPSGQPSTYGGMPGTSLSFYATGFAPNEVVMVYKGRSNTNAGELVSAFRVDDQGKAGAAGSYQIPGNANGQLNLDLVGRQSKAATTASMSVQGATGTVKLPEPPKYVVPPDLQADPVVPGGPPPAAPSAPPAPPAPPSGPAPGGPGNPPR